MARVSIIADDNMVAVDGVGRSVDTSALVTAGTHAVQWHETYGEVEFKSTVDVETGIVACKPNEFITDFAPYQPYVDAWEIENAKAVAKEVAVKAKIEADKRQAEEILAKQKAVSEAVAQIPQKELQGIIEEKHSEAVAIGERRESEREAAWSRMTHEQRDELLSIAREI